MKHNFKLCPCGSRKDYVQCCGRYIEIGDLPQSPERLMRSRYTAYVACDNDYLLQTWHMDTRPEQLELEREINWLSLEIISCRHGMHNAIVNEGYVEFIARYTKKGRTLMLHELSRFQCENEQWFYVDGKIFSQPAPKKTARNTLCPCGSGKKFKRCCGS
ncbi:MAG: SEC-C domain-containing protein [Betaproteobacteria bacterium]|nr:SEC-C domain-containing protein [Betaproteobacteria bacterium]